MAHSKTIFNEAVAEAVAKGLGGARKTLPSWLFYDEAGDRIFQQIMRMPEYYPTRCEYDILQSYKEALLAYFIDKTGAFKLIELGAGDGLKTEILLRQFIANNTPFTYFPIDISSNALKILSTRLTAQFPQLRISPLNKTYEEALTDLHDDGDKKVILFMGANIGNFTIPDAIRFLKQLALPLRENDLLLIGFDLKKDPRIIQDAYDDPRGLTESFNRNILERLNRELGARFNQQDFSHYPYYDPETGTTKSYLISMKEQVVDIEALERSYHFASWETIQTETSQKYDLPMIGKMMALTGLKIVDVLYDKEKYFCDILIKPA